MQKDEQKSTANRSVVAFEIVFLTIMAIVVYGGGILLLGEPINRHMPNWFFCPIGLFLIIGLDIIWIFCIKLWKLNSVQMRIIKNILSVFIFALSASVLTNWLILNVLSDIW